MSKNSMLLITSKWDDDKTFRLIPIELGCPYEEIIYMPKEGVLAIISKTPKSQFTMVPKLNENGDLEFTKNKQPRPGSGKTYKEERKTIDTLHEYYIEDKSEIYAFIGMFAINADEKADLVTLVMTPVKKQVPPGEITFNSTPGPIAMTDKGLQATLETKGAMKVVD